jgi:hypothetical protein
MAPGDQNWRWIPKRFPEGKAAAAKSLGKSVFLVMPPLSSDLATFSLHDSPIMVASWSKILVQLMSTILMLRRIAGPVPFRYHCLTCSSELGFQPKLDSQSLIFSPSWTS